MNTHEILKMARDKKLTLEEAEGKAFSADNPLRK